MPILVRKFMSLPLLLLSAVAASGPLHAAEPSRADLVFMVDGKVALASLMALSDGYLTKLADSLQLVAASPEAQSGEWQRIKEPLTRAAQVNVAALNWYALPDGSYWSVQEGKAAGNLATRAYFPKALAGHTVLGALVVSKATGKSTAIVAVPIVRPDNSVVGILGSSVYLDQLSKRLEQEMGLDDNMIFYSFDAQPLKGLVWEPDLIFADPTQIPGEEQFARAVREMMTSAEGVKHYTFRNKPRTVLFRRSTVTGWWYAFGSAPQGREGK